MTALVQTTRALRNGTVVKCFVEPGQEPPVTRDEAVSLLRRVLTAVPAGVPVRDDIARALTRERVRAVGLVLAALLLGAAPTRSQELHTSRPDGTGAYTVRVVLPGQPVIVAPPGNHFEYAIDVPPGHRVEKVWSFIGNRAGERLEAGLDLVSRGGFNLHQRSEHRETPGQYDAWKSEDVDWVATRDDHTLRIIGIAYCTGGTPVGLHYELRLRLRQVSR